MCIAADTLNKYTPSTFLQFTIILLLPATFFCSLQVSTLKVNTRHVYMCVLFKAVKGQKVINTHSHYQNSTTDADQNINLFKREKINGHFSYLVFPFLGVEKPTLGWSNVEEATAAMHSVRPLK